jgi:hypothetical protein
MQRRLHGLRITSFPTCVDCGSDRSSLNIVRESFLSLPS